LPCGEAKRQADDHIARIIANANQGIVRTTARFSLCFTRERLFLGQTIFAKKKTKKAQQEDDRHIIKASKEISMQPLILLAVVSMMVLYVLIIVGCLFYVGRHGRRTS
jgi:hypothetical protein